MASAGDSYNGWICELPGCPNPGARVDGSPVYLYVCPGHARMLGLTVRADHVPQQPPRRTLPLDLMVANGVRGLPLQQAIVALEEALAAPDPLEHMRAFLGACRWALTADIPGLTGQPPGPAPAPLPFAEPAADGALFPMFKETEGSHATIRGYDPARDTVTGG